MTFDITKCKPFDLERALAGDKVVTRDGREVTQITRFFELSDDQPIFCVVNGVVRNFSEDGTFGGGFSKYDLFMAPKTKKLEAWVNVYEGGFSSLTWPTKEYAENGNNHNERYIKTIKIETEIEV